MKCPIDNTDLVMSERQGIEIDYCPAGRGVWPDRGDLEKIIERSAPTRQAPAQQHHGQQPRDNGGRRRYGDDEHDRHYPGKRRESLLSDLFDF